MTTSSAPIAVDIHLSLNLPPEAVQALGVSLTSQPDPDAAVAKAQTLPVVLPLRVQEAAMSAFSDLAGMSLYDLTGATLTMTTATTGGGTEAGPEPEAN